MGYKGKIPHGPVHYARSFGPCVSLSANRAQTALENIVEENLCESLLKSKKYLYPDWIKDAIFQRNFTLNYSMIIVLDWTCSVAFKISEETF